MNRQLPRALLLILFLLVLSPLLARAQSPEHLLVKFKNLRPDQFQTFIDAGYDLWGIEQDGSVVFAISQKQLAELSLLGVRPASIEPLAFPPQFDAYHDYAEMVAELQAVANAYPNITSLQTIGQTHEGRDIFALRITDHPRQEEPDEQGILIFANTHAREHLTLEQALFLIRDLVENYGKEGEATNLINERDIWIIPNLNPDGTEYDINRWSYAANPPYWRKNRRDNNDGTFGVDLNRNFPYRWGCCGGSSNATSSILYRGPAAGSEPETQHLMQFVNAHDNLTTSVSLHTWGELILYPYGYTYQDIPTDMDPVDHAIFVALAQGVSDLNGYVPEQASDLYITDGVSDDWLYAEKGLYAMTWELYPRTANPGFYPPDSKIPAETERNRQALRYIIAQADDPRKAIGAGSDMTPPEIEITAPASGAKLLAYQPVTVTVTVSDNVGVTTVAYLLDGQTVGVRSAPDWSITLKLLPGQHELSALAFDHAHWQTFAAPVTLDVVKKTESTLTATPTATLTESLTPTPSPSPTSTLTPTITPSPTITPTTTLTPTLTLTLTLTPTLTATPTLTPSVTVTSTLTPTATPTPTPSDFFFLPLILTRPSL